MTPQQLHILQHSLGVDQYGQGARYRNHFCAGGKDDAACRELVALGFMSLWRCDDLSGGCQTYHVTREGVAAMLAESPPPPRLTRGKPAMAAELRTLRAVRDAAVAMRYAVDMPRADMLAALDTLDAALAAASDAR